MMVKIGTNSGGYKGMVCKYADEYLSFIKSGKKPKMDFVEWMRTVLSNTNKPSLYSNSEVNKMVFDTPNTIETDYYTGEVEEKISIVKLDEIWYKPTLYSEGVEKYAKSWFYHLESELDNEDVNLMNLIVGSLLTFGEIRYNENGFIEPTYDDFFQEKLEIFTKEEVEEYYESNESLILNELDRQRDLISQMEEVIQDTEDIEVVNIIEHKKDYNTKKEIYEFLLENPVLDEKTFRRILTSKKYDDIDFYNRRIWEV